MDQRSVDPNVVAGLSPQGATSTWSAGRVAAGRRHVLRAGALALLIPAESPLRAASNLPRIGFLWDGRKPGVNAPKTIERLRELGWVPGRNLILEEQWTEGDAGRVPLMVGELARTGVDLVVAAGPALALAWLRAAPDAPVVVVVGTERLIVSGQVESLARPGRNVTGLAWSQSAEISGKYVELLKEALPGLKRLGCIIEPMSSPSAPYRAALTAAGSRLGVDVSYVEVRSAADLEPAFATLATTQRQAVGILGAGVTWTERAAIAALARRHRLPSIGMAREMAADGYLMSYGPSLGDLYRRAASYVDKILRGAKPGDLAIEQPSVYELIVNQQTADALGLTIPPALLLRTTEVIA